MQTLDAFDADHAFMLGLVRQHRRACDIADGINTGNIGVAQTIGDHATAIGFDTQRFKPEILDIADHADSGNQPVGGDFGGRAFFILYGGGNAVGAFFDTQHLGAGEDFDPLLFKALAGQSGNFGVFDRQNLVHHFHHGHFSAHGAVERGEFDADCARSHHNQ